MPQPVDLVVDRRLLFDVRVRLRDVRLRLVVVVVGHEVLNPVLREELTKLVGELRCKRLVRREDQCWLLQLLDGPCDGCRLPRPRDSEQRLESITSLDSVYELGDRHRLVTGRRKVGMHPEGRHLAHPVRSSVQSSSTPTASSSGVPLLSSIRSAHASHSHRSG